MGRANEVASLGGNSKFVAVGDGLILRNCRERANEVRQSGRCRRFRRSQSRREEDLDVIATSPLIQKNCTVGRRV